jgi:hypothetical protein
VHTRLVLTTTIVVAIALSACSSDGDTGGSAETTVAATAAASDTASDTDTDTDTDTDSVSLTGEQICERLSVDSVAADTGLDVTRAVPDDSGTPQCAYEYNNNTGAVSNLTVAAMRPTDTGGLTGGEAYDFVARINESVAGDGAETQDLSAGDAAVRISGSGMQLGVLQVGDQVLTLIIADADVGSDAVDRLITTMATTLG